MLISFSVENFRSIRERQSLILEASADKTHSHSHVIAREPGPGLLKSAAIYGANASGKSNLIRAMIWMRRFVLESIAEKVESPEIPIEPFRLQKGLEDGPTVFEVEFMLEDLRYRYGFAVSRKAVEEEWLFRKRPKGRPARVFIREGQSVDSNSREEKGLEPFAKHTRPNALFLKVCAAFNFTFAEAVMEWFRRLRHVSGLSEPAFIWFTANRLREASDQEEILRFIRKADFNISGITSKTEPLSEEHLPPFLPPEEKNRILAREMLVGEILTRHRFFDKDGAIVGEVDFDLDDDESEGTRKFIALAGPILHTIAEGSILLIDEFEARLHPNLTKAILHWFHGPQNRNNAQIVLTTHDTGLMDPALVRRDQIWFCEKDERGGTSLYSLDEFDKQEVRPTTKFQRQYLEGIFGAVPKLALEEFGS